MQTTKNQPKTNQGGANVPPSNHNFVKFYGQFDKFNSSYFWIFEHSNGAYMKGYSKPSGQPEKADKKELVKDFVRRLIVDNRYLDPHRPKSPTYEKMSVYRDYHDGKPELIFVLHRHEPEFKEVMYNQKWLIEFLTNLYPLYQTTGRKRDLFPEEEFPEGFVEQELKKAEDRKSSLFPTTRKVKRTDAALYDLNLNLNTQLELITYCNKLVSEGENEATVYEWAEQFKDFRKSQNRPLRFR